MTDKTLTQKYLKDVLYYSIISGKFYWLKSSSKKCLIGTVAGYINDRGYVIITVHNKHYRSHRLAFLYLLGYMPEEVDHDNHIRHINSWINLNASCRIGNSRNSSKQLNNTSDVTGVTFDCDRMKWRAQGRTRSVLNRPR